MLGNYVFVCVSLVFMTASLGNHMALFTFGLLANQQPVPSPAGQSAAEPSLCHQGSAAGYPASTAT